MTMKALGLLAVAAAAVSAQPPQIGDFRGMQYEVTGRRAFTPQVKGSPYSAQEVTESVQTLADGSKIRHTVSGSVYRDVEGRVRLEHTVNRPGAKTQSKAISIVDPIAGVQYELNSDAKQARKMTFQARQFNGPQGPGQGPKGRPGPMANAAGGPRGGGKDSSRPKPVVEALGHQSFDGVDAEGTRMTTTIPAGTVGNEAALQIITERWYSAELQQTVMTRHVDPRVGETVYKLTNISRANPDASLFTVPSDFAVSETAMKGGPQHRPAPKP
jgi:hypothetical protein